jgi:hypothetical protein
MKSKDPGFSPQPGQPFKKNSVKKIKNNNICPSFRKFEGEEEQFEKCGAVTAAVAGEENRETKFSPEELSSTSAALPIPHPPLLKKLLPKV